MPENEKPRFEKILGGRSEEQLAANRRQFEGEIEWLATAPEPPQVTVINAVPERRLSRRIRRVAGYKRDLKLMFPRRT